MFTLYNVEYCSGNIRFNLLSGELISASSWTSFFLVELPASAYLFQHFKIEMKSWEIFYLINSKTPINRWFILIGLYWNRLFTLKALCFFTYFCF